MEILNLKFKIAIAILFINFVASADDWPQWLGPNRDGISTEKRRGELIRAPEQLWKTNVGVGVSSIVVSNGRAFAIGHQKGTEKRDADTVYCLDADSGEIIWKYPYDCLSCQSQDVRFYGPRSTPTVDGDTIFTLSLEGHLFCFEASSGNRIWSKNLQKDFGGRIPVYGYCCSPLVHGRMLIIELNAAGGSYAALDKSNGSIIWRFARGDVTCGSPVLTRIDQNDCAVFMGGGTVMGVNAATGTELWRHSTWGHAWMGPVVSGNKIFVANASLPRGCGVIQIDNGKPTVIWNDREKKFQTLHCNSVIWQEHIYGFDNTGTDYQGKDSKKSSLKCLELDTGQVKWTKEKMGWGNLIIFNGKLIILREEGELVIASASPEKYEEFSRASVLGGQSWTVPALAEGKLYCRNNSGDIVCLKLVDEAGENILREKAVIAQSKLQKGEQSSENIITLPVVAPKPAVSTFISGQEKEWPRFRGPGGLGIASFEDLSTSENKPPSLVGSNVLWKATIPLPGQSSPVVWANRVFITGGNKDKREVYCFDADTGRLIWQKEVAIPSTSSVKPADDNTLFAASTPIVDGYYLRAIFGNGDVICLDFEGQTIWSLNIGAPDNSYGHCASLELCQNLLIVQFDQDPVEDNKSSLLALDSLSGHTVWQTSRPVPCSWSSPIIINAYERQQIITCGDPWVIAYEPATGKEIWRVKCLGGEVVPSPISANGLVFAVSVDGKLAAISADGQGDVTASHIIWAFEESLPSICSPICDGNLVWLADTGGLVTCCDAKNGQKVWKKDLGTSFQASPSLFNGLLYLLSDDGTLFVLGSARKYELVGRFEIKEQCQASPAFHSGRMFIRTKEHLYCFGRGNK